MEDQFEAIADECSRKAAKVDCPDAVYRDGLLHIIERLHDDISASVETSKEG